MTSFANSTIVVLTIVMQADGDYVLCYL